MTRFLALFALCFVPGFAVQAEGPTPVLVELFASQNCSACPKAHRTMREVSADRDDVFVLTWSVDYWDYLGDPDPMALDEAKSRQATYAENFGIRAPYTPQSVDDGVKGCPGSRKKAVLRNITERLDEDRVNSISMARAVSGFTVSGQSDEALELTLIEYLDGDDNTTTMVNPVTLAKSLGLWTGQSEPVQVNCTRSCAVLLHKPDYGEIINVLKLN